MSLPTSAAFRRAFQRGATPMVRAVLYLADRTTVRVGGDHIAIGGLSVTGATSSSGSFDIGAAIVGTATVTLANYDGWLDLLDLEDATALLYAGADIGDGEVEWALLGTYDVDVPTTRGRTYPLQLRDWMGRFEVPYSAVTTEYPATLGKIVADICDHVGITMASATFQNSTHEVASRPTDELSCIDMLGFVAQLSCSFARMTPEGELDFGWYDMGAFDSESWLDGGTFAGVQTPYEDGDAADGGAFMTGGDTYSGGVLGGATGWRDVSAIRSLTTGAMDVIITGVRVTAQQQVVEEGQGEAGETALFGQEGYVLELTDNPLVPYGTAATTATMVGQRVVGLTFRTVEADVMGDPSLQAGDAMVLTDRLGRAYRSYVTQATWSSGGSQRLACGAEPPSRKSMQRTGPVTRAINTIKDAVQRVTAATKAARRVADEANDLAAAMNQHFWTADDGVHVTQASQASWETEPHGANLLANALGIAIRTALTNLVTITKSAIAFFDGEGNEAENIVARFGKDGSAIGYEGGAHVNIDQSGFAIYEGPDRLYEVRYQGQLVGIYGGGTTAAEGSEHTNAYVEALLVRLNGGYTVDLSTMKVLLPTGADSGMTVAESSVSGIYDVLDSNGQPFDSGNYAGILYDQTDGKFRADIKLFPQAEDLGAPIHEEMGGVSIDFADGSADIAGAIGVDGSVEVRDGTLGVTDYATSGEPHFGTNGQDLTVGLSSGTRMLFRQAGMESARDGSSMLLAIGSGQNTFQEGFAVLSDGSVVACNGKARFGGDASYLYLRDSSNAIWRIEKSSGNVQGYVNGAWRSLYFLATQSRAANTVLAAPNGSAGTPSFRALAHADMPRSSYAYLIGSAGAASYVRFRVVSGLVWIQANIASGLTITANGITVNSSAINVAYRPDREVTAPIYHSSNNTGCMWMDTSGYLHMSTKASSSQTTAYGELVYPIN